MGNAHVPSTTAGSVDAVKGFLIPIYSETAADGRQRYGLGRKDFDKVCAGYACPECLADFGSIYRIVCPACGYTRDLEQDVQPEPDYWKPDPNDPDRAA